VSYRKSRVHIACKANKKKIFECTLNIQKWPLVENFPPFVRGHALVPPPNLPYVNLCFFLTKIHKHLLEPFDDIGDVPGGRGKLITL